MDFRHFRIDEDTPANAVDLSVAGKVFKRLRDAGRCSSADFPYYVVVVDDAVAAVSLNENNSFRMRRDLVTWLARSRSCGVTRAGAPLWFGVDDVGRFLYSSQGPVETSVPRPVDPDAAAVVEWLATGHRDEPTEGVCAMLFDVTEYLPNCVAPPRPPHDGEDVERLLQFFSAVPAARRGMHKMAPLSRAWESIVAKLPEIEATHLAGDGKNVEAILQSCHASVGGGSGRRQ